MNQNYHIEVGHQQKNYGHERICGDVFLSRKVKEENRLITVLSDGMGHGVKANILATLTSTMALNFAKEHRDATRIADIIMNTLPVCSQRNISYSTFTILDVETEREIRILEYDNPECIIVRENKIFEPEWACLIMKSEKNAGKEIKTCTFQPALEDRIIFCSDGITQSGMGSKKFPFGWGQANMKEYILNIVNNEPNISAGKLAGKIVNTAYKNDDYFSKDDSSCAVLYLRKPRKLLLCTGPPFAEEKDKRLASILLNFEGKKIICGGTTGDIISRESGKPIEDNFEFIDSDLPPESKMEGVDLITEGILTLSKVSELLKKYTISQRLGNGPADKIIKLLLESDEIKFLVGTRINVAHQDPSLPVELEIRRSVVKKIANILEEKFLKEIILEYI